MKKLLLITMLTALVLTTTAFGESETSSNWGFGSSFPSMPQMEMPSMNMPAMPSMEDLTKGWGEFAPPENWGNFSFSDFDAPMTGTWGDVGGESDWGKAFEELQKNVQNGMTMPGFDSSEWPPASFKEMENAFNNQKENADSDTSGLGSLEEQFNSMFGGKVGEGFSGMPSLDGAQAALSGKYSLEEYTSSILGSVTANAQLSKISGAISAWGEKASAEASMDSIEAPDLGDEPELRSNMYGSFDSIAGGLKVNINTSTRYNGSLFTNAPKGE